MANETVQILTIKFDAAEAIANTRKLKEERDALIAETKKLEAEEGKYGDTVVENNAKIKVYNDQIREQEKVTQNMVKADKEKTGSLQQLKAQLSIATSQYNRLSAEERTATQAGKDLAANILELTNRLKASESAVGNNFRNVGNYKSALEGIPGPIGNAVKGVTGFNQTLKANPILAIVSLITLFTDVLGKIQPVADLVKQALGALSAVFDVIVNRLSLLIQGDFAGAFLGIGDAIGEAAKNGANYVKTLQDIEDTQRILDITNAESNKVVSNLLIKLKDRTKSEKERLDIADQITKEEKRAFEQQDALNKKALANEEKKVRQLLRDKKINADNIKDVKQLLDFADKQGITEENLVKLKEAKVKVINAETESNNLLEKAEVRRNQILDQGQEKRDKEAAKILANLEKEKQARQKYNEKIAELTEKFISTEREKLIAGFQKDLDEIKGQGEKEIALREAINRAKEAALTKFDNDARIKQIDRNTKIGIERIKLSQKTEEEKFLAESKITEDGLRKKLALLNQNNKEEANAVQDLNLEIQKIQQDRQKRLTEFAIADLNQQVTLNNAKKQNEIDAVELSIATEEEKGKRKAAIILKYAQEELALIEKIALIDGTLTDQEIENIKRLENAVITAQNNINKAQQQNPPKTIGELFGTDEEGAKKIEKGIVFAQQSLSNLIGIINQRYQQEIQGIDEAQAAETEAIKNSELSEDEKNRRIQESNKKYALQKYDLQVKQFNADKALQLVNATIAGARAVLTGLAEFGPIGAAISGALAAAQIAVIAAQKPPAPPKFAKGIVGLEGPGNGTSDSIPAYLSKGESVITASGTRFAQAFYPGLLNFLNSKNKFADGVVNFNQASAQSPTISIASEIRAAIQDITIVTKVSDIDKASFDRQSVRTVGVI